MKPLQFTIPVPPDKSVIIQEDKLTQFYPYLHKHKEVQLVWIQKGTGTLLLETQMFAFKPNDVFFIGTNQAHVLKSDARCKKSQSLSLFFDNDRFLQGLSFFPEIKKHRQFLEQCHHGFKIPEKNKASIIQQMEDIQIAGEAERFLLFLQLLKNLSVIKSKAQPIVHSHSEDISEGEGIRMRNIYNYVFSHLNKPISLEDVAAVAHLTPPAFCRYFKKHTRVSFMHFLSEIRVNEAKRKLSVPYNSIADIAYESGFNSIPTFNRVFKQFVGVAPGEFVNNYLKNTVES